VNVKGLRVGQGVHEVLSDAEVSLERLESVVWSHWHDYTGDILKPSVSIKIGVGPGFKENLLAGYPADPDSALLESEYAGHEMEEINFDNSFKIGYFNSFNFFEDGSFHLLNILGHAVGHICGLARTTEITFVLLGAEALPFCGCHTAVFECSSPRISQPRHLWT
jgi:hypothetical protein